jgi:hypothetical protein
MSGAASHRALMALLGLDKEPASPEKQLATDTPRLSLDERVDIYLRGVCGPDHDVTREERLAIRNRMLDAMADEIVQDTRMRVTRQREPSAVVDHVPGTLTRLRKWMGSMLLPPFVPTAVPARVAIVFILALCVFGAAWSGIWLYAAHTMERTVVSWLPSDSLAGEDTHCDSRNIGGFPFRLQLFCAVPEARLRTRLTILVVSAQELRATASMFRPTNVSIEITGPVSISEIGQPAVFEGRWTHARAAISPGLAQVSATIDGSGFYRITQNNVSPLLTSDRLELVGQLHAASAHGKANVEIAIRLNGGLAPPVAALASEPFTADAALVLRDVELSGSKAWVGRLREWQVAGGQLDIMNARMEHGGAVAIATGTVSLDGGGRVEGDLNMTLTGIYAQAARSFIAEREGVAQSRTDPFAATNPRSLNFPQSDRRPDTSTAPDAPRPRMTGPFNVPIRFVDGSFYFGSVNIGTVPPLF